MKHIKKILVLVLAIVSLPFVGYASTLYLAPQFQSVYQGDNFLVEIRIDTENEEINTVEANLSFPADLLQVVDISNGSSILNLWAQPPSGSSTGISFVGGVANGFKGDGLLARISFSAQAIGETEINFKKDSRVLLNDGQGSEAQLKLAAGSYEILAKPQGLLAVSSGSHLEQNKWYSDNVLQLYWDLVEDAEYSYLLSHDFSAESDDVSDRPEGKLVWVGALEYKGLEDGIYYFTLKEKLPGKDWSETVRFKSMIDTIPPEPFELKLSQISSVFEGQYFLSFAATDKTSGIDYYEVKEQPRILGIARAGSWQKADSPYLLTDQSLRSIIKVRAVDKASNEKIMEIVPSYKPSVLDILFLTVLLTVGILIWIFFKKKKKKQDQIKTNEK